MPRATQQLVHWALVGARGQIVDKNDKVTINSPETAKALEYVKALYADIIPGTRRGTTRPTTRRS